MEFRHQSKELERYFFVWECKWMFMCIWKREDNGVFLIYLFILILCFWVGIQQQIRNSESIFISSIMSSKKSSKTFKFFCWCIPYIFLQLTPSFWQLQTISKTLDYKFSCFPEFTMKLPSIGGQLEMQNRFFWGSSFYFNPPYPIKCATFFYYTSFNC